MGQLDQRGNMLLWICGVKCREGGFRAGGQPMLKTDVTGTVTRWRTSLYTVGRRGHSHCHRALRPDMRLWRVGLSCPYSFYRYHISNKDTSPKIRGAVLCLL